MTPIAEDTAFIRVRLEELERERLETPEGDAPTTWGTQTRVVLDPANTEEF